MAEFYYIVINDRQIGPLPFADLELYRIKPDTLVWHEELPDWIEARNLPELSSLLLTPLPPPIPQRPIANIKKNIDDFDDEYDEEDDDNEDDYLYGGKFDDEVDDDTSALTHYSTTDDELDDTITEVDKTPPTPIKKTGCNFGCLIAILAFILAYLLS